MLLEVVANGSLHSCKSFYMKNLRLLFNAPENIFSQNKSIVNYPNVKYLFLTRCNYENYAGYKSRLKYCNLNGLWGENQMKRNEHMKISFENYTAQCHAYQYSDENEILFSYILSTVEPYSHNEDTNNKVNLLVTEVPVAEYAPKLMESIDFSRFHHDDDLKSKICVHLTEDSVLTDPLYKDFMYRISKSNNSTNSVKHFVINSSRFIPIHFHEYESLVLYQKYFDVGIFHKHQIIEEHPNCLDPIDYTPQECHGIEYDKLYYTDSLRITDFTSIKRHSESYLKNFNTETIMQKALDESVFIEDIDNSEMVQKIRAEIQCNKYPKITFIGTAGSVGYGFRGSSCILMEIMPDVFIMLECGEGSFDRLYTTFGMKRADHIIRNLHLIYISHQHVDHYMGAYKLLKHKCNIGSKKPINVVTNKSVFYIIGSLVKKFRDFSIFSIMNGYNALDSTEMHKINTAVLSKLGLKIKPISVSHCNNSTGLVMYFDGVIGSEKVKWKIAFSGDKIVVPNESFEKAASNCDLLIHEASYAHYKANLAEINKHSTTLQVLECSKRIQSRSTILTHISPAQYPVVFYDTEVLFNPSLDASVYEKVYQAMDFMTVNLDSLKYLKHFESLLPIFYYRFHQDAKTSAHRKQSENKNFS